MNTLAERMNMKAWFTEAEKEAMNVSYDETIIIEIGHAGSVSGHPETLIIDDECFNWAIHCD